MSVDLTLGDYTGEVNWKPQKDSKSLGHIWTVMITERPTSTTSQVKVVKTKERIHRCLYTSTGVREEGKGQLCTRARCSKRSVQEEPTDTLLLHPNLPSYSFLTSSIPWHPRVTISYWVCWTSPYSSHHRPVHHLVFSSDKLSLSIYWFIWRMVTEVVNVLLLSS